jgi:gluconate 5-dehydrogenase
MIDLFDLTGKVALVTGGTHGIGLATAILLGKAGAKVCVNDLNDEKLQACSDSFRKEGLDVFVLKFDVTDEYDVDRGISLIEKKSGPVDILVNNAGIIKRIPILDMSISDFKQVIEVDLVAPLILSKRVVRNMIRKRVQ